MRIRVGTKQGDIVGSTGRALQVAADAVAADGGGVLEIGPGVYHMEDSLHLGSGVSVMGAGKRTVLRKCRGPESPLVIDADYGQLKLTPRSVKGLRAGMGVSVGDDESGGWRTTVTRITAIEDGVVRVADHLVFDYRTELNGSVRGAVSVISAIDCEDVSVENLVVDGNGAENALLNGCRGGGIYFHKARRCRIARCTVKAFNGDGISFQITQDMTVEDCTVTGCANFGLHPGTGSARPVVRGCRFAKNGTDGIYLCWRVQEGLFEDCEIASNGRFGVSVGHKDTDNLFSGNVISGNALAGVHFRDEKESNAGSRNTFVGNRIESNGRKRASPAVEILGETSGLVFERNIVTPGGRPGVRAGRGAPKKKGQRSAFFVGPKAERPKLRGNRIAKHPFGEIETAARFGHR